MRLRLSLPKFADNTVCYLKLAFWKETTPSSRYVFKRSPCSERSEIAERFWFESVKPKKSLRRV